MNSRADILSKIKFNKPPLVDLPKIDLSLVSTYPAVFEKFCNTLTSIGGKVIELSSLEELSDLIKTKRLNGEFVVNTIPQFGDVDLDVPLMTKEIMNDVDTAIIKGEIGVAENGAVWLYESQMVNRLLPFICQHLILVIEKKNIVATMHHAYQRIDIAREGFGAFIAGPSKTADIEQSLVIGAHGARSLTLYLIE